MNIFRAEAENSYQKRFDYDVSGNVIYAGEALPGMATSAAAWSIRKYTYTNGVVTAIQWAQGSNAMINSWDSRTSLLYS